MNSKELRERFGVWRDEWKPGDELVYMLTGIADDAIHEVERLEAENGRLREALTSILKWADPYALPNCFRNEADVERASAALKEPTRD